MKVYFNNSCSICRAEINLYKKENVSFENLLKLAMHYLDKDSSNLAR